MVVAPGAGTDVPFAAPGAAASPPWDVDVWMVVGDGEGTCSGDMGVMFSNSESTRRPAEA
jgi:hypothetical protein